MNDLLLPAVQKSMQDLDPYYNLVSLHLKGDVNTGRTYNAFSDASSNGFRLTNNGDVRGSSFSPFNSSWSNYFDGTDDRLSVPDDAKYYVGSSDFTIECWIYNTAYEGGGQNMIFEKGPFTTAKCYRVLVDATSIVFQINFSGSGSGSYTSFSATGLTNNLNQWYHIAFVRNGSSFYIFRNGVQVGSTGSISGTTFNSSTPLIIGGAADGNNNYMMNGYISNFRIITGQAVATSTFTTPTSPLTTSTTGWVVGGSAVSLTGTVGLLTCQSNRFLDTSASPLNITVGGGTPTVSSFSPFLDTDTVTGSGYFDGNGDYLTSATGNSILNQSLDILGGDHTIELWFYPLTSNPETTILTNFTSSGGNGWTLGTRIGALWITHWVNNASTEKLSAAVSMVARQWYHLAVVKLSGNYYLYINGVDSGMYSGYTRTAPTNGGAGTGLGIGAYIQNLAYPGYTQGYVSNIRVVKGSAVYTANFAPPTAPLTAIANTSLLTLQDRGAYNTIGFEDESEYQHVITRSGNTTQGTFSPFSNAGWSNYFSSANISCPNINFSTNAFCIEGWFYFTDVTTQNINLWGTTSGSGSQPKMNLVANYQYNSNLLNFDVGSFGTNPLSASMSYINNNAWNHIAIVREGTGTNQAKMYINGTARSTGTFSGNCSTITGVFNICYMGEVLGIKFPGWVSNFRIVNGSPVYTADFTPSTTPLTAITNTVLLTCQANRFVDSNTQVAAKTITLVGSPTIQPFSPFLPTSAWSASTVGGSGYFDGTGDYLTNTSQSLLLGTLDWCIECWGYWTSFDFGTYGSPLISFGGTAGQLMIRANKTAGFSTSANYYSTNGGNFIPPAGYSSGVSAGTLYLNSWNHIALTRSGSTFRFFINGALVNTQTDATSFASAYTNVTIGADTNPNSGRLAGYTTGVRVVTGNAVYTAAFTPPTAPPIAISGTYLLLNFTNAGIIDSTGKNVIETVGNAGVVTTTIKKYGTGSMFFDGTGDYLTTNNFSNPLLSFGTGDFTIEYWAYASSGTNNGLFQLSDTAGGFKASQVNTLAMNIFTNNAVSIYANGTSYQAPNNTLPYNSWTHFAIVRSSNVTKLYANGSLITSIGSSGSITDNTNYTGTYVVVGGYYNTGYLFTGDIDDFRVTKGYARYVTGTGANANQMVFNGTNTLALPTKALPDRGRAS